FPPEASCGAVDNDVKMEVEEHDGKEIHSEFHINYKFECDEPDKLGSIDFKLLKVFESVKKLDVQLVTPKSQRVDQLAAGKISLDLR
ncbi:MAG: DUF2796 domain-containing protein, partial [Pseudomonadota bacterium]